MKNSQRIKEILVNLAVNDKLPLDMTELDSSLFAEFDHKENHLTSLHRQIFTRLAEKEVSFCNNDQVNKIVQELMPMSIVVTEDIDNAISKVLNNEL